MNIIEEILKELTAYSQKIDGGQMEAYVSEIVSAGNIFTAGAGRSGLMMRAFAMRLMHLGMKVHVLGDATVPSAGKGDLLLIGSGSGETKSLISAAEKAKACGMRIALNTMDGGSRLAALADTVLVLPGASPKVLSGAAQTFSVQPMGSAYEQLSLLVYDAVIMRLMERMGISAAEMFERHANIE